jgi:mannose-1-phosphate guanylyltransferase
LFGGESLLSQTRARLGPLFRAERTTFVVTGAHEAFYREDLRHTDASRVVVQPLNRGTGVAIATALLRILQHDADAVAAFFPCDHYYADPEAFSRAVASAVRYARDFPDSVVLIGAEAENPEVEYGWIEPGLPMRDAPDVPLFCVNRFWEKPTLAEARSLLRRRCLWNTFVTIGRAETFVELLCSEFPDTVLRLAAAVAEGDLDAAYGDVPAVDFSREVLALHPHRLLVVRDESSGWADLGTPDRLIETLARNRVETDWLTRRTGVGLSTDRLVTSSAAKADMGT